MDRDERNERPKVLLVSEQVAAQCLCVSYAALKQARNRGCVPYHRIGDRALYSKEDLRTIRDARQTEEGRFN